LTGGDGMFGAMVSTAISVAFCRRLDRVLREGSIRGGSGVVLRLFFGLKRAALIVKVKSDENWISYLYAATIFGSPRNFLYHFYFFAQTHF